MYSDQLVHPPSKVRVLVYSSLESLAAAEAESESSLVASVLL